MAVRIVRNAAAAKALEEALAYGLLNFGLAVEHAWKADVVVRGGHRSFNTDLTKAGTPRIGGTLRRSIHTVLFRDGRRVGGAVTDENQETVPEYADDRPGARVFVGTNSGYGAYVELGTSKMPARPAGVPALMALRDQAPALIAAGVRRKLGQ